MVKAPTTIPAESPPPAATEAAQADAESRLDGRDEFEPRTPLGRDLLAIRRRIVESGQPLLDWDGIEREVAVRRGGRGQTDRGW